MHNFIRHTGTTHTGTTHTGTANAVADHTGPIRSRSLERGQASVEYALVLLGAALVASLLIAWATKTDLLDQLFDHVMNLIKGKAK